MGNVFYYEEQARDPLFEGAEKVYKAVKTTMGPKGRNVVIKRGVRAPSVTHDGVTVAKNIIPTDEEKQSGVGVGIEMLQSVAVDMDSVGDGTTTVTVLAYHILSEARKLIAAGYNPMEFKPGITSAVDSTLEFIKSNAEPVTSQKRLSEIATISAGEEETGNLVAEVIHKVGENSIVTVDKGTGLELTYDIVKGFTFDRGYISPYMMTDTTKLEAVYEKPLIFLTDRKLVTVEDILPVVEAAMGKGHKEVLIVAADVESEALGSLINNKLRGTFNAVCVKTPFGDDSKEVLEDLAILTGANIVRKDAGDETGEVTFDDFGRAAKVVVTKDKTTIIDGKGKASAISNRVKELTEQGFTDRVARLEGRVASIKIGGATEAEIEEKAYRVEDAVAACKAALAEGILPGGGTVLLHASKRITGTSPGEQVMKNALAKPYEVLMENSNLDKGAWQEKILTNFGWGVNVKDPGKLVHLTKTGIIDPAKVTREAVQNAASIASTMITVGGMVVDQPEKKDE